MPTKKRKAKVPKSVQGDADKLKQLEARHPFKIGDALPADDVLLNIVKYRVSRDIHESALVQSVLTVDETMIAEAGEIVLEFNGWLAGEHVEQPLLGTVLVPKSWWQMFKRDVLGVVLHENDHHAVEVRGNATLEVVYPHLKLPKILPEVKGVLVRVRGTEPNKEYQTVGVK